MTSYVFSDNIKLSIPAGFTFLYVREIRVGDWWCPLTLDPNVEAAHSAWDGNKIAVILYKDRYQWPDWIKEGSWLYKSNDNTWALSMNKPRQWKADKCERESYYGSMYGHRISDCIEFTPPTDNNCKYRHTGKSRIEEHNIYFTYYLDNKAEFEALKPYQDVEKISTVVTLKTNGHSFVGVANSLDYVIQLREDVKVDWSKHACIKKGTWVYVNGSGLLKLSMETPTICKYTKAWRTENNDMWPELMEKLVFPPGVTRAQKLI